VLIDCSFFKPSKPHLALTGKQKLELRDPLPESSAELEINGYEITLKSEEHIPEEFRVKFRLIGDGGYKLEAIEMKSGPFCRSGRFEQKDKFDEVIRNNGFVSIHFHLIFQWDDDVQDHMHTIYGKAFDQQLFADIKLVTNGGRQLMASKLVLSAHSDVFRTMFEGQFSEKDKSEVNVQDDYETLLSIVRFMYDRTLELKSVPQALELMLIADKYNVQSAKKRSVVYITEHLTADTVMSVFEVADKLNVQVLGHKCVKYLSRKTKDGLKEVRGWAECTNSGLMHRVIDEMAKRPVR
jgi:hypothetical protein